MAIDFDKLQDSLAGAGGGYRTVAEGGEGEIDTPRFPSPVTDFDGILREAGFDPAEYELASTPRVSTWDAQTPEGLKRLYSYRISVRKIIDGIAEDDIEAARLRIQNRELPPVFFMGDTDLPEVSAVVNMADAQIAKSEGGGISGLTDRILNGLENIQAWLDRCRLSYNVSELILVNNGDVLENIAGNYASQQFTVEGNLRQQMNYALDFWDLYASELLPQFERKQFVTVLSNHGELGRLGTAKNQTSDSDNADAFLAEALKRIYKDKPGLDDIQWTIPRDEMNVYTETATGVKLAFCHGHKIKGSDAHGFETWLNGQQRGDIRAWEADIWVTAHRHNFQAWDLGSCSVFQCPSLDGGSKWFKDSTGRYSQSGMIGFLAGQHTKTKWSDLAFL
ncbi:hypothetical protein [Brevibacterium moorei]|uniref:hypothetical protein n=1 Tax=Brevibacterium moorei TaxID=2968457 RepID=UPI00211BD8F9|nr:hypothetical protein [Brevibacterium sp. 68QC2CO]MCQ9385101.1 hypothetical protein [Brevibacterium sp. 68QC2CO]